MTDPNRLHGAAVESRHGPEPVVQPGSGSVEPESYPPQAARLQLCNDAGLEPHCGQERERCANRVLGRELNQWQQVWSRQWIAARKCQQGDMHVANLFNEMKALCCGKPLKLACRSCSRRCRFPILRICHLPRDL